MEIFFELSRLTSVALILLKNDFFFSCFIALWNSLVKAETVNHKGFTIVYSHSLFFCGIAQLVVTLVMLQINESYGQLMKMFGVTLMTAAIPVFILLFIGLRKKQNDS